MMGEITINTSLELILSSGLGTFFGGGLLIYIIKRYVSSEFKKTEVTHQNSLQEARELKNSITNSMLNTQQIPTELFLQRKETVELVWEHVRELRELNWDILGRASRIPPERMSQRMLEQIPIRKIMVESLAYMNKLDDKRLYVSAFTYLLFQTYVSFYQRVANGVLNNIDRNEENETPLKWNEYYNMDLILDHVLNKEDKLDFDQNHSLIVFMNLIESKLLTELQKTLDGRSNKEEDLEHFQALYASKINLPN